MTDGPAGSSRGGRASGRTPLLLTVVALSLLGAGLLLLQPYSADWPGTSYAEPARRYIRAALRQDSAELSRLSVSGAPVAWALNAGRSHRDSLALWAPRIQAWTGEVRGDTAEVFVYPAAREVCGEEPIVFQFVGTGTNARVLAAASICWSR